MAVQNNYHNKTRQPCERKIQNSNIGLIESKLLKREGYREHSIHHNIQQQTKTNKIPGQQQLPIGKMRISKTDKIYDRRCNARKNIKIPPCKCHQFRNYLM